jgi:pimeloyl-ACP methyl ester carboxylesterase
MRAHRLEQITADAASAPMPHIPGVEHRFVDVGGVRLHIAEAGQGDPVVLLHGWPQHWWSWRELIGPLSERYRVLCPDIRGMGWSQAPASGYGVWDLTAELWGVLDDLGLHRVRLIGQDWGTVTGYHACFEAPERIERFVPISGVHPWSALGSSLATFVRPWHIYLQASPVGPVLNRWFAFPERLLRYWRHAGRFTDEEAGIYTRPLRRPGSLRATVQRYRSIVGREIPWYLRNCRRLRLSVPTLHINGDRDPLAQGIPDSWRRFADEMRWEVAPDCGHFPPEEQPEWVLEQATEFLT